MCLEKYLYQDKMKLGRFGINWSDSKILNRNISMLLGSYDRLQTDHWNTSNWVLMYVAALGIVINCKMIIGT